MISSRRGRQSGEREDRKRVGEDKKREGEEREEERNGEGEKSRKKKFFKGGGGGGGGGGLSSGQCRRHAEQSTILHSVIQRVLLSDSYFTHREYSAVLDDTNASCLAS